MSKPKTKTGGKPNAEKNPKSSLSRTNPVDNAAATNRDGSGKSGASIDDGAGTVGGNDSGTAGDARTDQPGAAEQSKPGRGSQVNNRAAGVASNQGAVPGTAGQPSGQPAAPAPVTVDTVAPVGPSEDDLKPHKPRRTRTRRGKAEIEAERVETDRLTAVQASQDVAILRERSEQSATVLVRGITSPMCEFLPPQLDSAQEGALIQGWGAVIEQHGGDIPPMAAAVVITIAIFLPRVVNKIWGTPPIQSVNPAVVTPQ